MNDVDQIISQLEQQKAAIDRAISALREITGPRPAAKSARGRKPGRPRKSRLSDEGRQRISEAAKQRWAAKRAAEAAPKPARKATKKRAK